MTKLIEAIRDYRHRIEFEDVGELETVKAGGCEFQMSQDGRFWVDGHFTGSTRERINGGASVAAAKTRGYTMKLVDHVRDYRQQLATETDDSLLMIELIDERGNHLGGARGAHIQMITCVRDVPMRHRKAGRD